MVRNRAVERIASLSVMKVVSAGAKMFPPCLLGNAAYFTPATSPDSAHRQAASAAGRTSIVSIAVSQPSAWRSSITDATCRPMTSGVSASGP